MVPDITAKGDQVRRQGEAGVKKPRFGSSSVAGDISLVATSAVGARGGLVLWENLLDFRAAKRQNSATGYPPSRQQRISIRRRLLPTAPMGSGGFSGAGS